MWRRASSSLLSSPATPVAIGYVVLASAWILLSDWALNALVAAELVRELQTLKGWFFVAVTGALLWIVLGGYDRSRRQARERQVRSERQLQVGLEALRAILLRFRSREPYEIVSAMGGIGELTDHPPGELTSAPARSVVELVHPDDRLLVFTAVRASARDGRGFVLEFRLLTRGGEVRWAWCKGRPVEEGEAVEMFLTDLSRLKQLEARLLQSQRLEALAELAAGIGHEVNNLLAVVQGHAELGQHRLLEAPDVGGALTDHLAEVRRAAERATALNQRLLRLGRPSVAERQEVELNDLVDSVAALLRPVLRRRVALECERASRPLVVEGDARQLEQVLVNLALNARDAMAQGGRLTVAASLVEVRSPCLEHGLDLPPGRYGCLTVADTGTGIPEDLRERVFEPFFTTKPTDAGTGLGLAVVAALVDEHRGRVAVDSTPGEGTTFRVFLPLASSRERDSGTRPASASGDRAPSPVWSY